MSNDELDTGLEHVLVAETRLSKINGSKGALHIGGFSLDELAPNATFEETTYLLRHDRFPTVDELSGIRDELADVRSVPATTLDTLRAAAGGDVPAIDALRMGAAAASLGQAGDDPNAMGWWLLLSFQRSSPPIRACARARSRSIPVQTSHTPRTTCTC